MLDEDVILKSTRYINERILIFNIVAISLLPAMFFGGSGATALSLIFSLGIIAPINVFTYPINWIDAPDFSRTKYAVCVLPVIIASVIAIYRFFTPSIAYTNFEQIEALRMVLENSQNLFTSAATSFFDAVSDNIVVLSSCFAAFSIFIITKSRFVIKTMLMCCAAGAVLFSAIGLILDALYALDVPAVKRIYTDFAFFTFADKTEFSFYAYIWASALLASGIYTFQRFSFQNLFGSLRFLIMLGSIFLFAVSVYTSSEFFKPFIYATAAFIFVVYTFDVFPTKSNLRRHNKRLVDHSFGTMLKASTPAAIYIIMAACSIALCAFSAKPAMDFQNAPERAELKKLDTDAMDAALEKQLFGWGGGSFQNVMAIRQGDDIENIAHNKASSDIIKAFLEYGFLGIAMIASMPILLFIYIFAKFGISKSQAIMLVPVAVLAALSFVSTPFLSPSVIISFWILSGSIIAWGNSEII